MSPPSHSRPSLPIIPAQLHSAEDHNPEVRDSSHQLPEARSACAEKGLTEADTEFHCYPHQLYSNNEIINVH